MENDLNLESKGINTGINHSAPMAESKHSNSVRIKDEDLIKIATLKNMLAEDHSLKLNYAKLISLILNYVITDERVIDLIDYMKQDRKNEIAMLRKG
jgi:hypothetical protein